MLMCAALAAAGFAAHAEGPAPLKDGRIGYAVADAHFSAIRDGVQYNLHASRELNMERLDLQVGPIRIEVLEPLHQLRVVVDGEGLKADLARALAVSADLTLQQLAIPTWGVDAVVTDRPDRVTADLAT